jgi:chromosome segregation ATPase
MVKAQRKEEPRSGHWTEDQLQDTQARLHKLENELDQVLKHVWSVDADVRTLNETVSSSASASLAVDKLREDIRQLSDSLERQQERQNELANRIEESSRQHQAEVGRDRNELSTLAGQVDAAARSAQQYDARIQALDEALRHNENEIAGAKLFEQGLERSLGDIVSKAGKTQEATIRISDESAQLAGQLEKLEQEEARVSERMTLMQDQIKRLLERAEKLDDIAEFPKEVKELVERATFERDQLSQRINIIDKLTSEATERVQALNQAVALIDQRSHNQVAQLTEVATQLQELEELTTTELRKIIKVTLRQRRRQVESLSQEIRELSKGEPKTED